MPCCQRKTDSIVYIPENNIPTDKVLKITAFVTFMLALFCLGVSHILRGVSLLPHKYTQGLEHIYGLSSICLKRATVIFGAIAVGMLGLGIAVQHLKKDEITQSSQSSETLVPVHDSNQSV